MLCSNPLMRLKSFSICFFLFVLSVRLEMTNKANLNNEQTVQHSVFKLSTSLSGIYLPSVLNAAWKVELCRKEFFVATAVGYIHKSEHAYIVRVRSRRQQAREWEDEKKQRLESFWNTSKQYRSVAETPKDNVKRESRHIAPTNSNAISKNLKHQKAHVITVK